MKDERRLAFILFLVKSFSTLQIEGGNCKTPESGNTKDKKGELKVSVQIIFCKGTYK